MSSIVVGLVLFALYVAVVGFCGWLLLSNTLKAEKRRREAMDALKSLIPVAVAVLMPKQGGR